MTLQTLIESKKEEFDREISGCSLPDCVPCVTEKSFLQEAITEAYRKGVEDSMSEGEVAIYASRTVDENYVMGIREATARTQVAIDFKTRLQALIETK